MCYKREHAVCRAAEYPAACTLASSNESSATSPVLTLVTLACAPSWVGVLSFPSLLMTASAHVHWPLGSLFCEAFSALEVVKPLSPPFLFFFLESWLLIVSFCF